MRTTVNMPDELHRTISALAAKNQTSLSETTVRIIRNGLGGADPLRKQPALRISDTGLPVFSLGRPITNEELQEFLNEDE